MSNILMHIGKYFLDLKDNKNALLHLILEKKVREKIQVSENNLLYYNVILNLAKVYRNLDLYQLEIKHLKKSIEIK